MDNVATYHNVDPATGYLQAKGNYAEAFTPERKQQWLDVYKASGLRFLSTCKSLGISDHTINHHIEIDQEFKAKFKEVQAEYAEELEALQRDFAKDKKQFMDRAMQLRALLPGKYARDERRDDVAVTINISNEALIEAKRRSESMDKAIEAEIVRESRRLESASMGDNGGNNDHARPANT